MFEKEAEEYQTEKRKRFNEHEQLCWGDVYKDFQKGATFGYNKANEWHYTKDVSCYEDLHFPPQKEEKGRVLIWKVQVITENGVKLPVCYHCGSYGDLWYEMNAYHVIAWKEIVLPKESE